MRLIARDPAQLLYSHQLILKCEKTMFNSLSERLSQTLKQITGQAKLTEDNIKASLREVRMALLEADVALPVVKSFIDRVKERAVGQEVSEALNPGQQFLKIVQDELVHVMGDVNESLDLKAQPPAIVLMAGLQGAGKTTTTAKLARFLKEREKKKVMVVSADVYRPAAINFNTFHCLYQGFFVSGITLGCFHGLNNQLTGVIPLNGV